MAGVVRLWNNLEVQILVLISFMLQVFLLMFAGMRRRNISVVPRTLLWLAYLLADFIAIYILGHMSFSSKSHEKQQLMAFWAPFLLVHLGGQDTITAYSIEDNQLWPRHLLTFAAQALGVAYVLCKYIGSSGTFVTAATLMFVTGVLHFSATKHPIECIKREGELHKRWEEIGKRREGLDLDNIDIRSEAIGQVEIVHKLTKIREELMDPDSSPLNAIFGYIKRSQELDRRIHELDKRRAALKTRARREALDRELDKINEEVQDLETRKEKLLYLGSSPPPALARGADLMESLVYMEAICD